MSFYSIPFIRLFWNGRHLIKAPSLFSSRPSFWRENDKKSSFFDVHNSTILSSGSKFSICETFFMAFVEGFHYCISNSSYEKTKVKNNTTIINPKRLGSISKYISKKVTFLSQWL